MDAISLIVKMVILLFNQNPDVAAAGLNPFTHFMESGWREGRDPNALFDTSFYLDTKVVK